MSCYFYTPKNPKNSTTATPLKEIMDWKENWKINNMWHKNNSVYTDSILVSVYDVSMRSTMAECNVALSSLNPVRGRDRFVLNDISFGREFKSHQNHQYTENIM